jgi:hypothetical protein
LSDGNSQISPTFRLFLAEGREEMAIRQADCLLGSTNLGVCMINFRTDAQSH